MDNGLPNCWEIISCGREKGGDKVAELGECVASTRGMGHSCWAVAGTLCGLKSRGRLHGSSVYVTCVRFSNCTIVRMEQEEKR